MATKKVYNSQANHLKEAMFFPASLIYVLHLHLKEEGSGPASYCYWGGPVEVDFQVHITDS